MYDTPGQTREAYTFVKQDKIYKVLLHVMSDDGEVKTTANSILESLEFD